MSAKRYLRKQIITGADDLRLNLAAWAAEATDAEREKMGEKLASLRTDLMELIDGNYDPTRLLPPNPEKSYDQAVAAGET